MSLTKERVRGFTVVELMIVLCIIGILLGIALPSYQQSVLDAGRAEAKVELLQVASIQETFYSISNSYSVLANPLSNPTVEQVYSQTGLYVVTVAPCNGGTIANCFTATATPIGKQVSDSCTTLTLTNTGFRGATGDTVHHCW